MWVWYVCVCVMINTESERKRVCREAKKKNPNWFHKNIFSLLTFDWLLIWRGREERGGVGWVNLQYKYITVFEMCLSVYGGEKKINWDILLQNTKIVSRRGAWLWWSEQIFKKKWYFHISHGWVFWKTKISIDRILTSLTESNEQMNNLNIKKNWFAVFFFFLVQLKFCVWKKKEKTF